MRLCRICSARPGTKGTLRAGAMPFTGFSRVLLITTQGQPTCLTCRQTMLCIIIPHPKSWQNLRSNLKRLSWRFFIARSGGNVPAELVFCCQDSKKGFLTLSLYSRWERAFLVALKKFFYFLFETFDSVITGIGRYPKTLAYFFCGKILNL